MIAQILKNRELYMEVPQKVNVYFVDDINLLRFTTTSQMLEKNLEVDMRDQTLQIMSYKEFIEWNEKEEFKKQDINDRTKTIWPLDSDLVLEDFKMLKLLGRGGFGKVVLVENMKDKKLYAMKILRKKDILESEQVEHTKAEKAILQHVNHPFLVSLHSAYSNKRKIYFVMELMRGGELYCHLGKLKRFSEAETKFLVACIVLALGHLHSNNFIYR